MSTILDVLRRAQEDARSRAGRGRIDPGDLDGIVLERNRPRRRFRAWMLAPVALVLLAGIAGGLFLTEGARAPRARRTEGGGDVPPPDSPAAKQVAANPGASPVAAASAPTEAAPAAVAPVPLAAAPAPAAAASTAPPVPVAASVPPAKAAEPPPAPRVAATRAPLGRGSGAREALADAPIGVPRPPDYLEKRVGPDGKAETWLRRMDPGSLTGGAVRKPEPAAAAERKRPLVRHAEEIPPPAAGAPDDGIAEPAPTDADRVGPADEGGTVAAGDRRPSAPVPEVRRLPTGLPEVEVNIVQWSPSADRRFAFVRIDGSTMVKVREGDEVGGLRVVRIHPQGIELAQDDGRWLLRTD